MIRTFTVLLLAALLAGAEEPPIRFQPWGAGHRLAGLPASGWQAGQGLVEEPGLAIPAPAAGATRSVVVFEAPLPEAAGRLGLWLRPAEGAGGVPACTLRVRDGTGREHRLAGDPRQALGRCAAWTLLGVDLCDAAGAPLPRPLVLRDLALPAAAVLGRLQADPGRTARADAAYVWRLHDIDWRKPSAIDFTRTYLEHAYDRPPLLEVPLLLRAAAAWRPGDRLAAVDADDLRRRTVRVRLELRGRDGSPRQAVEHDLAAGPFAALAPPQAEESAFLRLKAWSEAGELLALADFALQVVANRRPLAEPSAAPAPLLHLATQDGAWSRLARGPDAVLAVRFPAAAATAELRLVDEGQRPFAATRLDSGAAGAARWPLPDLAGRPCEAEAVYRAADGRVVDADLLRLAAPTPEPAPLAWPRAGVATLAALFAPGGPGLFSENLAMTGDGLLLPRLPDRDLPVLEARIHAAGSALALAISWDEFEPVEGAFRFAPVDALVARCRARGQAVVLSLWMSGDRLPEWLWYDALATRDGRVIGGTYRYVSPFSERTVAALERAWRQLIRRYGADPAVLAWGLCAGGSEGLLRDLAPASLGDYSPAAEAAFRRYLAQERGLDLAAINRRHAAAWPDLAAVRLPALRPGRDPTLGERDVHDFKQWAVERHLGRLLAALRAEDPVRPITVYSLFGYGDVSRLIPLYRRHGVVLMNGGAESVWAQILNQLAVGAGVPVLPEPHDVPPATYNLNRSAFNSLVAGGFSGLNICNGLTWAKNGFAADREQTALVEWKRILRERLVPELIASRLQAGAGILYSYRSAILATGSFAPESHSPAINALADALSAAQPLSPRWLTEGATPAQAAALPIVIDSGSVCLDARLRALVAGYLAAGGTLVAGPATGRLGEEGDEPYRWLREMGCRVGDGPGDAADDPAWRAAPPAARIAAPVLAVAHPQAAVLCRDEAGRALLLRIPAGRGTLVLALGEVDWRRSPDLLRRLLAEAGAVPRLACDAPDVALGLLATGDGGVAVPLLRTLASAPFYLSRADCLARGLVAAQVRVRLPPGTYAVRELTAGGDPVAMDAEALWRDGIPCPDLAVGDLRVLRIAPR